MTRDVRAIVAVFAGLFGGTAATLLMDPPAKGWFVFALVVAFNVALPLTAKAVGRDDWFAMWALLLPISVLQIVPDWILADLIGTLRFPDIGGPRVDDVIHLAMGGMWVAPLFIVLALSAGSPARAAGLALVVFLGSELLAPTLKLWEPAGDPTELAGVALYVLPAEAALGWATATAYLALQGRSPGWAVRVGLGAAVATFYTGALVVSYFFIDVAGWSLTT
ncbi:MAG: hypothetical protein JHC95_13255 [Solirubrobacteraceae bacterium]|nr:hypothetical protein [Solirubrobacteraceae bacterium]